MSIFKQMNQIKEAVAGAPAPGSPSEADRAPIGGVSLGATVPVLVARTDRDQVLVDRNRPQ